MNIKVTEEIATLQNFDFAKLASLMKEKYDGACSFDDPVDYTPEVKMMENLLNALLDSGFIIRFENHWGLIMYKIN